MKETLFLAPLLTLLLPVAQSLAQAPTPACPHLTHAQVSEVFMPVVGHFPPLETPDRFAKIVADSIDNGAPLQPAN